MLMNRDEMLAEAYQLRAIDDLQTTSPITFFEPQSYQRDLFDDDIIRDKRIIGVLGGNKSGKTYASCAFIIKKCLEKKNFCIVSTWSNLLKELSRILYDLLPKNDLVTYAVYNEHSGFIRRSIHFSNGSQIQLLTLEQGRERFQSYSCDYILLDEEPPKEIYDECLFRIAHTKGKVIISATPVKGFTYLAQLFQVQAKTDASIISFQWDSLQNAYIDTDGVKAVLDSLTDDQMQMRRFGKFINQKSGLVFNKFDWDRNVTYTNPFFPDLFNSNQPIIACVDFNYVILPIVLMQKYGDKYFVFDTVSMTNGNTETVSRQCKLKYPSSAFHVYCDAAGNANKTSASRTDVNILEETFGVRVKYRVTKSIKDRTEALNAYLCNAVGDARLFIHQSNKELLADLQLVDWTLYEGRRKQLDRTHHVDALSYYFAYEHALNWNLRTKMM